jgi:hypothetical protein
MKALIIFQENKMEMESIKVMKKDFDNVPNTINSTYLKVGTS